MKGLALALILLGSCSRERVNAKAAAPPREATSASTAGPPHAEPAPPLPKAETAEDKMNAATTYTEALAIAGPQMSDSIGDLSPGAILLAKWAGEKMHWADVAVEKNETSLKLAMKDSDEARGKRLCASGRLGEIEKISSTPKVYSGGLIAGYSDVYRFLAVGSTGELVAESRARLCGVVVGQYAYPNTGGGQTKSVMLVGMFDLPENKPAGTVGSAPSSAHQRGASARGWFCTGLGDVTTCQRDPNDCSDWRAAMGPNYPNCSKQTTAVCFGYEGRDGPDTHCTADLESCEGARDASQRMGQSVLSSCKTVR